MDILKAEIERKRKLLEEKNLVVSELINSINFYLLENKCILIVIVFISHVLEW